MIVIGLSDTMPMKAATSVRHRPSGSEPERYHRLEASVLQHGLGQQGLQP